MSERDVEFALRLPVLAMVPAIEPPSAKKQSRLRTEICGFQLGIGCEELGRLCIKNSLDYGKARSTLIRTRAICF